MVSPVRVPTAFPDSLSTQMPTLNAATVHLGQKKKKGEITDFTKNSLNSFSMLTFNFHSSK